MKILKKEEIPEHLRPKRGYCCIIDEHGEVKFIPKLENDISEIKDELESLTETHDSHYGLILDELRNLSHIFKEYVEALKKLTLASNNISDISNKNYAFIDFKIDTIIDLIGSNKYLITMPNSFI